MNLNDYPGAVLLMVYFYSGVMFWEGFRDTSKPIVQRRIGLVVFLISLFYWAMFVSEFIYNLIHLT